MALHRIAGVLAIAALVVICAHTPVGAQPTAEPFDAVAATQAYLDTLTPEQRQRSDAYYEGGYWLTLIGLGYSLAVAWLLLGTGLSAAMRGVAERVGGQTWLHTMIYVAGYVVLMFVIEFPYTIYADFFREHEYGLATQTLGPWFSEKVISLAINVILLAVGLALIYAVIRRSPRRWWIWGSGVGVAFLAFVILIGPVFIDPLFNRYTPMDDGPLKQDILSMARANGVPADDVYQFDASRQTTRISANVAGLLGTTRIALNDNLLNQGTPAEVRAVMAHEIGHYVLGHIYELLVSLGLVLVGGFAFVHWAFGRVHARWGERWGVRGIDDPAGLPLFVALLGVYFTVMTPVTNTIIRSNEVEADIFGLNAAREPDGFATIALKLAEYRKLEPGAVEEFVFFDHPSGYNRILMAMRWKAENLVPSDRP